MAYVVIRAFTDLQDGCRVYSVGDTYPRTGYKPTEKRCTELSGYSNMRGTPLIKVAERASVNVTEHEDEPVEKVKTRARAKKTK